MTQPIDDHRIDTPGQHPSKQCSHYQTQGLSLVLYAIGDRAGTQWIRSDTYQSLHSKR